jgi:LacI family transcriptional regulator
LLVTVNAGGDSRREREAIQRFRQRHVEGIILISRARPTVTVPAGLPLVLIGADPMGAAVPHILPDETEGARSAVLELIAAGHRRIGVVTLAGAALTEDRLQGYRRAMAEHSLPANDAWHVAPTLDGSGDGLAPLVDLLNSADRPTALFCTDDRLALAVYLVAARCGLDVGADLSVIGFGNLPSVADAMFPALTTVALPSFQMGTHAAHTLLDLVDHATTTSTNRTWISCPIVLRASVGPAPTEPPPAGRPPGIRKISCRTP